MKQGIHPEYREVAFCDLSINKTFIIKSTAQTKETVEIDGVTYPLIKLDTSSESHPFYTGAQTRIVEAGRVEKFRAKALKRVSLKPAAWKNSAPSMPTSARRLRSNFRFESFSQRAVCNQYRLPFSLQ